ncbi:hypothetical protein GGR52DRAFT_382519 [Hypoxylon sp. FL1284]|nr:hypothetical protein GGR52DRAFT_382519 [Hypoxylon sp. FL1284]
MNTVVSVAHKFGEWPDETSQWASPIFAAPFGDGMPFPDQQFWGNANSPQAAEELEQGFDATDNFDPGYAIENAGLGPVTGSSALLFDHQQQAVAKAAGQSDHHRQPSDTVPFRRPSSSYDTNSHEIQGDEDIFFDDSLTSSTATGPRKQLSHSPETGRSPYFSPQSMVSSSGSASGMWPTDGVAEQPSPTADAALTKTPRTRRNRERNRVAAHKCRQKAKQSMSNLQERERELQTQNRMLREHADNLHSEVLDLKTEILRHSKCDSEVIQSWIARAARDIH